MKLRELNYYLEEAQFYGNGEQDVTGFSIDSRQLKPGNLFFALAGEKVDGHQFVGSALKKGASGAVVSRIPGELEANLLNNASLILVPDCLRALQQLALTFRIQAGIPVVGITGSNGKTTTKDLVTAVLKAKYDVLRSEGNFNNEIGLPLSLLGLEAQHQVAVLEMGMRGLGQVRELCTIARPDYGIITNIGTAHFELLGSQKNIAQAKGELLYSLPENGVAILNRDDLWSRQLGEELREQRPSLRIIYYGLHPEADYLGRQLIPVSGGMSFTVVADGMSREAFLPLPGQHNVQNALAALAIGSLLEIPLDMSVRALATATISEKRLAQVVGIKGSSIIDDTYNANPSSTIASLGVLASLNGLRKIAVLGSNKELGTLAEKGHREVGEKVAELGIDYLLTVGEEARWIADGALEQGLNPTGVFSFANNGEAIMFLQQLLQEGDVVLIKGSRALVMEEIVTAVTLSEGGAKK